MEISLTKKEIEEIVSNHFKELNGKEIYFDRWKDYNEPSGIVLKIAE